MSEEYKSLDSQLSKVREEAEQAHAAIQDFMSTLRDEETKLRKAYDEVFSKSTVLDIDRVAFDDAVNVLIKRPYAIIPKKEGEWYLLVLKGIPLNVGWFSHEEGAFNVFVVNRVISLIQPVPEQLQEELDLGRPFDGLVVDGEHLVLQAPEVDSIQKVFRRYKTHLTKIEGTDKIKIRQKHVFPLIARIIRDGILPFKVIPVDQKDLTRREPNFQLRPYQQRDYEKWLQYGSVGIFYPMGAGKSFIALYIMLRLRGPKLVMVPTETLKEQWNEYIEKYAPRIKEETRIEIYHYLNVKRLLKENKEWSLIVFDEMHKLGADHYIELTTLKSKYRLNLTGTPWREDGRIDLVWALSGMPLGVNWDYFIKHGYIVVPEITVWILKDVKAKLVKLDELLEDERSTIVFCDAVERGIVTGKDLAERYKLPFIHGQTRHRLETIRKLNRFIISRVGDLGISVKKLERTIEFSFLFGSRSQESQRMGRLLHDEVRGEHVILMTIEEYLRYRKRLYAHYEKGFKVLIKKGVGVPDDLSLLAVTPVRERRLKPGRLTKVTPPPPIPATPLASSSGMPRLDPRHKVTADTIVKLLKTDYAKQRGGLTVGEVRDILDASRMKYNYNTLRSILHSMYKQFKINAQFEGKARRYFVGEVVG